MRRTSLRRKTALLLLSAVLAVPLAGAARPMPESPRPVDAVEPAPVKLLRHAWSVLQSVWAKAGCHIDPNGLCLSSPAPNLETDAGCHIDPSGLCLSRPAPNLDADAGCHIDPDGLCHS